MTASRASLLLLCACASKALGATDEASLGPRVVSGATVIAAYRASGCCADDDCRIDLAKLACSGDLRWHECASACEEVCGEPPVVCTEQCVARCACPRGYVRIARGSDLCILRASCGACADDGDCDPERTWCRPTASDDAAKRKCVPFASLGAKCEGYVLPSYRERCAPGLRCEDRNDPRVVDDPGVCTNTTSGCAYEFFHPVARQNVTRYYNPGETLPSWGGN